MPVDNEVEDFLEHFGVKGMKWGVRKSRTEKGSPSANQQRIKKERNKMLVRYGAGITLAAGALGTAYILSNRGSANAKNTIQFEKHMREAAKLRQSLSNKKIPKNVTVPKVKARVSPEARSFMDDMASKMRQSVDLANEELRKRYEDTQTPFPLREYLTNTW